MAKPEQHAPANTLLGQLQRGRGEGYRRALVAPAPNAKRLLVECITNDPRLDSQVENRADYYAAIAMEVGLDLNPLAEHLHEHDDADQSGWNTPLTVYTLGALAKRGYGGAADILCDYIGWGEWWDWSLEDLTAVPSLDVHCRVARAIEQRFPSDNGLEEALAWFNLSEEPWTTLAHHSARISRLASQPRKKAGLASAQTDVPSNYTALTTRQLLAIADEWNRHRLRKVIAQIAKPADVDFLVTSVSLENPFVAEVALAGLAELAPPSIFGWLCDFWSANPDMPGWIRTRACQVMVALPPALTLPLARERLHHEHWHERLLAEDLFEAHATTDDIPLLRAAISQALPNDEDQCYRLCNLVEAFAHLPNIGLVPELSDVFLQFRYSYGRARAAKSIHITAPDLFRESFALECLWDCEDQTRALGARCVPFKSSPATERLRYLASDRWEDSDVRSAVTGRGTAD